MKGITVPFYFAFSQCRIYPMGPMGLHKKKGLHDETKDEKR